MYLNKDWKDGESSDDCSIVRLPGKDVESSDGSFDDFFHSDTVGVRAGRLTAAGALKTRLNCHY